MEQGKIFPTDVPVNTLITFKVFDSPEIRSDL